MNTSRTLTYKNAESLAQEAFHLCLTGDIYAAQELLLRVRNALKRVSGDLPIVGYDTQVSKSSDTPFVTQSFEEAQAWGWLEIALVPFSLLGTIQGQAWCILSVHGVSGDPGERLEVAH